MSALATPDQVRAIQTARRRAGLQEDDYRAALGGFGVASCKDLTAGQAGAFLDRLNGGSKPARTPSKDRATGPFAKKLQALWLAGWNLGVVRDRTDAAMMHFVERQTGITHVRFLRDPQDAAKAIEAVKAMVARDANLRWPKAAGPGAIELKRAVVAAQHAILADRGLYPEVLESARYGAAELDALSKRLGVIIRAGAAQP